MKNEKQKVELELERLGNLMADTAQTLAILDGRLAPYWYAKGDIESNIRNTHGRRSDGSVMFDLTRAGERKPLFSQLDELAREWGPVKTDRAEIKSRLSGYERDYKRLENEFKYWKRKADKTAANIQGTLL